MVKNLSMSLTLTLGKNKKVKLINLLA